MVLNACPNAHCCLEICTLDLVIMDELTHIQGSGDQALELSFEQPLEWQHLRCTRTADFVRRII